MTDLSPMIKDAFQDDSLPAADRDRLWSTMQHRQARQARAKLLVRTGLLLVAGLVIAAAMLVRSAIRSSSVQVVPAPVAADSIPNVFPVEPSMTQETHQEVRSDLIPLLGHRSSLRMDIQSLEARQLQLADKLDETTGREHEVISRQLASVEQQLEATRVAISVIDAQLAGQPGSVPPVAITTVSPPQIIEVNNPISDELIWASGAPLALLALGMVAMLGYLRRIARKTREALAAIENQVSSQHATLASGIDAIAVEVERLGEGQRFMSKVLAGSEAKPAPISRT